MKKLLIAAAVVITTTAHAQFITGNLLLEQMESKPLQAYGYIAGVFDTLSGIVQCAPQGVTLGQVHDMTRNYLLADPNNRNLAADIIITKVLASAWPCPKKGGPNV